MSEKEKEAILELKHYINFTAYRKQEEYTNSEIDSYIKMVLILIEKQQKEIREIRSWKYTIDTIEDLEKLKELDLIKIKGKEYISKDKIREKIREYEELVNEFEEYWSKDPRQFKKNKSIDYYKLEALKELLEEE